MSLSSSMLRLLMRVSTRKLYPQWRESLSSPQASQSARLAEILSRHRESVYGRQYFFHNCSDPKSFRQAVPIVRYDDLGEYFERMQNGEEGVLVNESIEMFAVTSGTMGKPKYIPVTRSMNLEQHRSHRIWMKSLVQAHPRATEGALLTMVSPAVQGYTPGKIPFGSASGKGYLNQAIPVRRLHAVPYEVIRIADYEAKYYCLLAFALARDLSCITSVNPSTIYLLGERMQHWSESLLEDLSVSARGKGSLRNCPNLTPEERRPLEKLLSISRKRVRALQEIMRGEGRLLPRTVWPGLAIICTWHGGNAPFYLAKLPELWGEVPARCLGLRASEGMFSIPLADSTPEGVLATWGHF
ncbi:MAG: GH3 auxin-responsive promoter family protein, partial [Planctomycetes bacterium]|nr:GH3 auxin-responsive promoter family protein [Planctomycetota bacterium]